MSISPSERDFISKGVESDIRIDGRSRLDIRSIYVKTGVLDHAAGSARVRLGDGTDILVGIKAETYQILPTDLIQDEGKLIINVECSPSSTPQFEGRGADDYNLELAQSLERALVGDQNGLDLKSLCIIPGNAAWHLYLDALVLGISGNLVDGLSYAAYAGLNCTRLANISVEDVGDGELAFELVDDGITHPLKNVENVPIITTLTKIGSRYIVDCSSAEEQCADAILKVSVNKSGQICSFDKSGSGSIDPSMLLEMLSTAQSIGSDAIIQLEKRLNIEADNVNQLKLKGQQVIKHGFLA